MHSRIAFIIEAYKTPRAWISALVATGFMAWLLFAFTDYALIDGNLGHTFFVVNLIAQILITFLFGFCAGLIFFRQKFMMGGAVGFGGALGAMIAGCPACGITLASALGIGSIFASLPFFGLELKFLALILLGYALITLTNPVCKVK